MIIIMNNSFIMGALRSGETPEIMRRAAVVENRV